MYSTRPSVWDVREWHFIDHSVCMGHFFTSDIRRLTRDSFHLAVCHFEAILHERCTRYTVSLLSCNERSLYSFSSGETWRFQNILELSRTPQTKNTRKFSQFIVNWSLPNRKKLNCTTSSRRGCEETSLAQGTR